MSSLSTDWISRMQRLQWIIRKKLRKSPLMMKTRLKMALRRSQRHLRMRTRRVKMWILRQMEAKAQMKMWILRQVETKARMKMRILRQMEAKAQMKMRILRQMEAKARMKMWMWQTQKIQKL